MDLKRRIGAGGILLAALGALLAPASGSPAAEKELSVDVGGYGSVRYEFNPSRQVPSSITLRRFVVTTDAHFRGRLQVYSEVEYERLSEIELERGARARAGGLEFTQELEGTQGSEIALEQAWGQYELFPGFGIRFGALLPPLGRFNARHDDNLWNFPRRPLIERAANVLPVEAAWTEMGLGIAGEKALGENALLSYELYALNGVELNFAFEEKLQTRAPKRNKLALEAELSPQAGSFDGSNPTDAVAGRIQISPALGSEYALSGYIGEYTPAFLEVDEQLWTLGVDGLQKIGPLHLEGEFLYTHYGGLRSVLADLARTALDKETETGSDETAALETEIEIAPKNLSENRYGFWINLGLPIALRRGFWGLESPELIPVLRYETVWFDDNLEAFAFAEGEPGALEQRDRTQGRLSLGLAFRPAPQTVFHLTYEYNQAFDGRLLDPEADQDQTHGFVFGMAFGF